MQASVASVTVAYNGRHLLARHFEALLQQKARLSEIIVVDNASSDGTADFLSSNYPEITLLRLSANEGVAGGYAAGLQYAICEKGYGWAWMLDQDSVPHPETLSQLLDTWEAVDGREQIGIIAPLPVDAQTEVPCSPFLWRDQQIEVPVTEDSGPVCFVDMVISSGSLISSAAVQRAGLPRKDFFIDFVDFEHCLRLRQHGFKIAVATRCRMPHTIGVPRTVKLFHKTYLWETHVPWRDYYKVRNRVFVVWHEFPSMRAKLFVIRKFIKQAAGTLLLDPDKLLRLRFMLKGLRHGIQGRLGKEIGPISTNDTI